MAVTVGDAVLKLGVDTKDFEKGMKGLKGKMQQHSRAIGLGMAAMGGAIVAAGALSIKTFAEMGDEVAKMALRTGFSTEALSELRHAAEISGATLGTLEKGVKKMAMSISDARDGLMTYTREFDKIGVSVEDLQDLNPEEQFFKIAEAIASLEDPTQRAASAQKILGRAGTELLPLFAEGREGMRRLREEAHELGIVFDQEAANKAAKMTDAMHRVSEATSGLKMNIADVLIPALLPLIEKITTIIKAVGNWMREHETLTKIIVGGTMALGLLLIPLGTLLIFLPQITTAFNLLKASKIAHTAATWAQTTAVTALNMSLVMLLATIGLLTLGIGMIAFGIIGLTTKTRDQSAATWQLNEDLGTSADITAEDSQMLDMLSGSLDSATWSTGQLTGSTDRQTAATNRERTAHERLRAELERQLHVRSALMKGLREAAGIVGPSIAAKALEEYERFKRGQVPTTGIPGVPAAPLPPGVALPGVVTPSARQAAQVIRVTEALQRQGITLTEKQLTELERARKHFEMFADVMELARYEIAADLAAAGVRHIGGGVFAPLQRGGIAMRPMLASIAEKRPEAVIPLDRLGGLGKTMNLYIELDGRIIAEAVEVRLTDDVRLKTGVKI